MINFDYSEHVLGTFQAVGGRSCPACFRSAATLRNSVVPYLCFDEVGPVHSWAASLFLPFPTFV